MKKSLWVIAACLIMVGTSACSTVQKQEDQNADMTTSSSDELTEESTETASEEPAEAAPEEPSPMMAEAAPVEPTPLAESSSASTSDLSLGAGSSGRGH